MFCAVWVDLSIGFSSLNLSDSEGEGEEEKTMLASPSVSLRRFFSFRGQGMAEVVLLH